MIERLAGRIILSSGWRRALTAFLSGAFATLTQPPFDGFVAGFVSFPILVWLIDGAIAKANAGPVRVSCQPPWSVGGSVSAISSPDYGGSVRRCWSMRSSLHGPCRWRFWACLRFGVVLCVCNHGCADFLVGWFGAHLRAGVRFCTGRMAATFPVHWFPVECHRLCRHADSAPDAIGCRTRSDRNECIGRICLCRTGSADWRAVCRTGIVLALMLIAGHVGFGAWTLSKAPAIGEEKARLQFASYSRPSPRP